MNDETIDEAQKADESQIDVESPATEELPVEPIGEEVEAPLTEGVETEGTPKEENRKTAESRIKDLVAEKKQKERQAEAEKERADSLADQVAKLTSSQKAQIMPPVQEPASPEGELTYEELMRRQDALVQMRLAQQENYNRIDKESVESLKNHPELDPDSEAFDPDLSKSISEATLAFVQANPTGSVKGFVNGLMKPYRAAVEKQVSGQKETIAKQVSEQAMRPTQVPDQEKPFEELSIEEMEQQLGTAYR